MSLSKKDYRLQPSEKWWSSNYDVLLERGYRLRDRYNPRVLNSWLLHSEFDDDEARRRGLLDKPDDVVAASKGMDAEQVSDGAEVWIKRCRLQSPDDAANSLTEVAINKLIVDDDDPHNHFLPFADVFVVRDQTSWEFTHLNHRYACVVFPWALRVNQHAWHIALEALDFVRQLLEGLSFLHRNHIAHGDIHPDNILMAPQPTFYAGVNRLRNIMVKAIIEDSAAPYIDRIEVPAEYWYIDLGLSSHFEGEAHDVVWRAGLLKLPEVFGTTKPSDDQLRTPPQIAYDAFAADVWQLGTTLRMFFGYSIPSLNPLLREMTDRNPSNRPTAHQCLTIFHARTARLPRWQLLLPVRDASFWTKIPNLGWSLRLRFAIIHYREWFRLCVKAYRLGLSLPQPDQPDNRREM